MAGRMPDQESPPQGGASELASFGEDLRREREIRGISLKEISDATKISKRFLEAIERNDHKTLPAPVFTRGFVREYARYVGLNAEDMVNRYNYAASNDDRIEKPPQIEKYPLTPVRDIAPKPKPKRGIPPAYALVNRNAVAVVIITLALAGVAWWAIKHKLVERDAGVEPTVVSPGVVRASGAPPPPAGAPEARTTPGTTTGSPPAGDSKLRIEIEATDNAWVTLEADGETVLNVEMPRGERRNFEAAKEFRFRTIGNAAGVTLRLNGIEIPPLGSEGEVIHNRLFDRASLERLRVEERKEQP